MEPLVLIAVLGLMIAAGTWAAPALDIEDGDQEQQLARALNMRLPVPSRRNYNRFGFWPVGEENDNMIPGDDIYLEEPGEKRGGGSLVTFRCVRTHSSATCKNGGKGPRVTKMRNGGWLCACMCPYGYENPKCEGTWWHKENEVVEE